MWIGKKIQIDFFLLITDAAGDLRYCYKGKTCHNSAKTLDGVPVSQEQCCNSPDAYSWGVGSISCMECIKTGKYLR